MKDEEILEVKKEIAGKSLSLEQLVAMKDLLERNVKSFQKQMDTLEDTKQSLKASLEHVKVQIKERFNK